MSARRSVATTLYPDTAEPASPTRRADAALPPPSLERHGETFVFTTADPDGGPLVVTLSRVREASDAIWAELSVTREGRELYMDRINLLSSRRLGAIKLLGERARGIDWAPLLEFAYRQTIDAIRRGTPAVLLRARPAPPVRHLVRPVLLERDVNVIFGPPGTLKSYVAAVLARLVATGGQLAGLAATRRCSVMVLDGEAGLGEWEGRHHLLGQGDGQQTDGLLYYRRLTRSLDTELAALKVEISQLGIGLLIVDSFGLAAGPEPEGADAAIRLLSALRDLGPHLTVLLICHVSQASAEQRHGATKPYGSIYVQALARSIWEARRDDDDGDDVAVSLFHRKCNVSRLHPPIALRFAFQSDRITVTRGDLAETPELLARAGTSTQILTALRPGAKTIAALAEELSLKPETVKKTLQRLASRDKVTRLSDVHSGRWQEIPWGLRT
jgi:hypothetical protein